MAVNTDSGGNIVSTAYLSLCVSLHIYSVYREGERERERVLVLEAVSIIQMGDLLKALPVLCPTKSPFYIQKGQ